MYYPFIAHYIPSSTGSRDVIAFSSLVNDFDCVETCRNIKTIFCLSETPDVSRPFNEILFVFNSSNNLILGNDKFSFIADGRLYSMLRVDKFILRYRFFKFLLRLVHDADKAFGSLDMCIKFLHDYSAGATPADLWSKYCWYRTFGTVLNENSDVFHDINF